MCPILIGRLVGLLMIYHDPVDTKSNCDLHFLATRLHVEIVLLLRLNRSLY